jgi:hypothetical protein
MNDIRKLIDILNETTVAGAVGGGPAVPLGATHKRMEEEQTHETGMPEVIEYGNWENSALVTEKKTRSMRPKSKRIVKSVYGVDNTSAEGGEASESKEPQDKKKKVSESAQSVAEDQDLQEQDLIVNPAAVKKAMGIIARDKVRTDHEVEMARSDLLATIKNAQSLYAMLKDRSEDQGLEGWVQEKLIKANDYLNAVKEYYDEKMMQEPGGSAGEGVAEGNKENKAKKNAYVSQIIQKKLDPSVLPSLKYGRQELKKSQNEGQGVAEGTCPECGGPAFSEASIAEAKDACYHKVKSRVKVWPSAYASGQLVQCRKRGAKNWGTGKK